jgi:hypothetical protein
MDTTLADLILYCEDFSKYKMSSLIELILDWNDTLEMMLDEKNEFDNKSRLIPYTDPDSDSEYYHYDFGKDYGKFSKYLTMLIAKSFVIEYNIMSDIEKENNQTLKEKVILIEECLKNIKNKINAGYAFSYLESIRDDRLEYLKSIK